MSKKKGKTPQPAAKTMTASTPKMEAFTFGEPVPVPVGSSSLCAHSIKHMQINAYRHALPTCTSHVHQVINNVILYN